MKIELVMVWLASVTNIADSETSTDIPEPSIYLSGKVICNKQSAFVQINLSNSVLSNLFSSSKSLARLLSVQGKPGNILPQDIREPYTLPDWHRVLAPILN